MIDRIRQYLLNAPLPSEGPARERLRAAQALIAAGLPTDLLAICWAEAAGCPEKVAHARRLLQGALPWPAKGRKRGPLVRAVEAWENDPLRPPQNEIRTEERREGSSGGMESFALTKSPPR